MVDGRAVTFRTLAVSAMIVLIMAPEALVHPSFQMSFAATLGLVALRGGREQVTLLLASLVAGLTTTPYAAFHFHRVTPYVVLANLAAMPVAQARRLCGRRGQTQRLPSAVVAGRSGRGRERWHHHLASVAAADERCDAIGDRPPSRRLA